MKNRILGKVGVMLVAILAGFSATTIAQELVFKPSLGGGSYFSDENSTFDPDALFFAAHVNALKLPFFEAATGVGVELGWNSVKNDLVYTIWSLNRADIMAGKVYGGADMKFLQSDVDGTEKDFDLRLVTGMYLGKVGDGMLSVEFYTLEENRPIAFSVMYKF